MTPGSDDAVTPQIGAVYIINGSLYVVTAANTVSLKKALNKKSFTLPASVQVGGKTYKIKVKVGNKKDNWRYVKKYRRIFTKENAGRRVIVK